MKLIKQLAVLAIYMAVLANTANATLVGYWSFDDSNNPAKDDSGNGNQGSMNAAVWVSNGASGGAVSFNGSDSWIHIGDCPQYTGCCGS